MIIAKSKPIEEIISTIQDFKKILVVGCDGCVTVCEAGGMKETQILASALRMYFWKEGKDTVVDEMSLTRQCDRPYVAMLEDKVGNYDAILSLACGAGVQFVAETYAKPVIPAVNTCFIGVTEEKGLWTERCQACGDCVLAKTGGICPVARCSKRMSNGPCGGSAGGKCEVGNKEIACGWALIYERLKELGRLDLFEHPVEIKNWASSRDGGPRKVVKEAARI